MSAAPVPGALAQLQRQFIAHLRGDTAHPLRAAVDVGRLPAATGLRIYAHAYGARLREALANDHPALGAYLGDAAWEALCRGYIDAHPSRLRSLRGYGDELPAYLACTEPFRAHPELAELARFERDLLDSFDAADDPHADWPGLQSIPAADWPSLRPRVHASVRVHHARHGSVAIWQAVQAGQAPPRDTDAIAADWVLWRDAEGIGRFASLDAAQQAAFAFLRSGASLAELCELLAIAHPIDEVPMRMLGYLQAWSAAGWIAYWDANLAPR